MSTEASFFKKGQHLLANFFISYTVVRIKKLALDQNVPKDNSNFMSLFMVTVCTEAITEK